MTAAGQKTFANGKLILKSPHLPELEYLAPP